MNNTTNTTGVTTTDNGNLLSKYDELRTAHDISFEDITLVFVTRLERNINDQLSEIKSRLTAYKRDLEEVRASIREMVKAIAEKSAQPIITEFYTANLRVGDIRLNIQEKKASWELFVKTPDNMYPQMLAECNCALDDELVDQYNQISEQVKLCEDEYMNLNGKLKSLPQKEREIRAILAEKKIQAAGLQDILNDVDLFNMTTA